MKIRSLLCLGLLLAAVGCNQSTQTAAEYPVAPVAAEPVAAQEAPETAEPSPKTYEIPRFAVDSPFEKEYESPELMDAKQLWAQSLLWTKAPELLVEKWLTDQPDTAGKYVLIEFWATWCPQCRKAVDLTNELHHKFGNKLVVIGVSDEDEQTVLNFAKSKIDYNLALDTQARTKDAVGVFGIPHVVILEPDGYVVWEGFPLLKNYELTADIVQRILDAGAENPVESK